MTIDDAIYWGIMKIAIVILTAITLIFFAIATLFILPPIVIKIYCLIVGIISAACCAWCIIYEIFNINDPYDLDATIRRLDDEEKK